jgi:hypothetical protein
MLVRPAVSGPAGVLLAGALLAGCATPLWVRRETVQDGVTGGRLYVPRVFTPVLPGSMYPNRAAPLLAATNRSSVVVVCPERRGCPVEAIVTPLGEHSLVAFVLAHATKAEDLANAVEFLGRRPECRGTPSGLLLYRPGPEMFAAAAAGAGGRAAVILGPPALPASVLGASPLGRRPFLVASLTDEDIAGLAPPAIEKLYRREKNGEDFPPEAFRDAADWLADELAK